MIATTTAYPSAQRQLAARHRSMRAPGPRFLSAANQRVQFGPHLSPPRAALSPTLVTGPADPFVTGLSIAGTTKSP